MMNDKEDYSKIEVDFAQTTNFDWKECQWCNRCKTMHRTERHQMHRSCPLKYSESKLLSCFKHRVASEWDRIVSRLFLVGIFFLHLNLQFTLNCCFPMNCMLVCLFPRTLKFDDIIRLIYNRHVPTRD